MTAGVRVHQTVGGRVMYKDAPSAYITIHRTDLMEVDA